MGPHGNDVAASGCGRGDDGVWTCATFALLCNCCVGNRGLFVAYQDHSLGSNRDNFPYVKASLILPATPIWLAFRMHREFFFVLLFGARFQGRKMTSQGGLKP